MAKPSYRVILVDTSVAHDRFPIVDAGIKVDAISALDMPAPGAVSVAFGTNSDLIPLKDGDGYDVSATDANGCPVPLDEGVFVSNVAGAGIAQILVSFGSVSREAAA
jgi:hypothetical protein